jgi:hypothetical protein
MGFQDEGFGGPGAVIEMDVRILENFIQCFGKIAQAVTYGQVTLATEGWMIKNADFCHSLTSGNAGRSRVTRQGSHIDNGPL